MNAALRSPFFTLRYAWPALNILQGCVFSVKMNYRIAQRIRDEEPLLWCCPEVLNQWVGDRKRMHICFSFSMTLSVIVMTVIKHVIVSAGPQGGEWGFALVFMCGRGRGCVGAILVGNVDVDLACRVHFIMALPSRGSGVCPTSFCE